MNKYRLTKLIRKKDTPFIPFQFEEITLCAFDTMDECADWILDNKEIWYICYYGEEKVTKKFGELIKKRKSLAEDFM